MRVSHMSMQSYPAILKQILLVGLSFCLLSTTAKANKEYQVEVLVFEPLQAGAASESHHYIAPREMKHEARHWLLSPSLLNQEAKLISQSDQYVLKHHYAWGIESLPYEKSANYTVVERDIKGYIKVYADQLLFANLDIDFQGFRMREKRRLKLNEKHYFDHPKFGILMQVSRLEKVQETEGDKARSEQPQEDGGVDDQLKSSR